MNHSCDPNTVINPLSNNCDEYEHYATKDIKIADEIYCSYFQFDYECDGHSFDCGCGALKCYKSIRGFKNLSLADQVELLPVTYPMVVSTWLKDNPKIVLIEDLKVPEGI